MSEIGIKDQYFGVEVEMTGITRQQAAQALAEYFGTVPCHYGHTYDAWTVKDPEGKEWKLVSDASIDGERWTGTEYVEDDVRDYYVEMVTPKLTYAELPKLQECMRRVRKAHAKVNGSCGIHVHIDASNHNRQSLKNLIGIMYSKEDILFKALQVSEDRASRWCKKVREPMLKEARTLSADETKDLTLLEDIWYEGFEHEGLNRHAHYNKSRYYALNLHSVFYRAPSNGGALILPSTRERWRPTSTCVWQFPPRPSPSAALSCARPTVTTSCSPSGCGWCGWASTGMSLSKPGTSSLLIWRGIVRGAGIRTAMKSTKGKNAIDKQRGDHNENPH